MKKTIYYNTFDDKKMNIDFYSNENSSTKSPLVVFFFGGGWVNGDVNQFQTHANELIKCGYVVANVGYRVYNKDNVTIDYCMKDAFYALKYLSDNADDLAVDTEKVFISGGSAGGHIALSCAILNNVENNFNVKGLILFNPVTDTTKNGYQSVALINQAFAPIMFSPYHHIRADLPPVLIMHGKEDTTVIHQRAVDFVEKYKSFGNEAELVTYEGCDHGFFNYRDGDNPYYFDTVARLKDFIAKHLD